MRSIITKQFTTKQMAYSAMLLGIIFAIKWIQSFIPDLPSGLGDITVLLEISIVVASIVIGFFPTITAVICYLLFSLIDIPLFLGGMLWVEGTTRIWVYLLDYFLPLVSLTFIGLFKTSIKKLSLAIIVFNLINYLFHVTSGVIFWGSYSWDGWGPWAYSVSANGIRNSIMLVVSFVILPFTSKLNLISQGQTWK